MKKKNEAINYLRGKTVLERENPKIYKLLAKTYAEIGKSALQHMALSDYYFYSGDIKYALEQLKIARKSYDLTFYDESIIDVREKNIRQIIRESEFKNKKK